MDNLTMSNQVSLELACETRDHVALSQAPWVKAQPPDANWQAPLLGLAPWFF